MCVCFWRCVYVCVVGEGRGGSLWVVTCLCPIHVAFCQVLTNAFVVLPIVRLSCEFYFLCAILISLTMPIKGNVFEKKSKKLFLFVASLLSSFHCDECPFIMLCHFHLALWNGRGLCSI